MMEIRKPVESNSKLNTYYNCLVIYYDIFVAEASAEIDGCDGSSPGCPIRIGVALQIEWHGPWDVALERFDMQDGPVGHGFDHAVDDQALLDQLLELFTDEIVGNAVSFFIVSGDVHRSDIAISTPGGGDDDTFHVDRGEFFH